MSFGGGVAGGSGTPPVADTTLKRLALTPDALAGSSALSALSITQTLNTTGVVDVSAINVTNTASGTGSTLANYKVGGSSVFRVSMTGQVFAASGWAMEGAQIPFYLNSGLVLQYYEGEFRVWHASAALNFNDQAHFGLGGAATFQCGKDHATTATTQTIKAHDVTAGTGANLAIKGGAGSVANGQPFLDGPGRVQISDISAQFHLIAATLFDHGLAEPPIQALNQISSPTSSEVTIELVSGGSYQVSWNVRFQQSLDGVTWTDSGVYVESGDTLPLYAYLTGFTADTTYYFRWRAEAKNNPDVFSDWSGTESYVTSA